MKMLNRRRCCAERTLTWLAHEGCLPRLLVSQLSGAGVARHSGVGHRRDVCGYLRACQRAGNERSKASCRLEAFDESLDVREFRRRYQASKRSFYRTIRRPLLPRHCLRRPYLLIRNWGPFGPAQPALAGLAPLITLTGGDTACTDEMAHIYDVTVSPVDHKRWPFRVVCCHFFAIRAAQPRQGTADPHKPRSRTATPQARVFSNNLG